MPAAADTPPNGTLLASPPRGTSLGLTMRIGPLFRVIPRLPAPGPYAALMLHAPGEEGGKDTILHEGRASIMAVMCSTTNCPHRPPHINHTVKHSARPLHHSPAPTASPPPPVGTCPPTQSQSLPCAAAPPSPPLPAEGHRRDPPLALWGRRGQVQWVGEAGGAGHGPG